MSGVILLILSLLSFAGLGVCHKVADFIQCKPRAINATLFFWAGLILWGYTFAYKVAVVKLSLFPPFTAAAATVAVISGFLASIAILTFQIGIRSGRISTSWLVINLATAIPALLSLIVYQEWKEKIPWQVPVGIALAILSVLLLWRDKAEEVKWAEQKAQAERRGAIPPAVEPRSAVSPGKER